MPEEAFPSLSQKKPLSLVGYVMSNRYLECYLSGVCLTVALGLERS